MNKHFSLYVETVDKTHAPVFLMNNFKLMSWPLNFACYPLPTVEMHLSIFRIAVAEML